MQACCSRRNSESGSFLISETLALMHKLGDVTMKGPVPESLNPDARVEDLSDAEPLMTLLPDEGLPWAWYI